MASGAKQYSCVDAFVSHRSAFTGLYGAMPMGLSEKNLGSLLVY